MDPLSNSQFAASMDDGLQSAASAESLAGDPPVVSYDRHSPAPATPAATELCCGLDKSQHLQIISADKCSDGGGKSYTAYSIQVSHSHSQQQQIVQRRYSEFESIRKILCRLYPHIVVPPIPDKHHLADLYFQSKKDDARLVETRRLMLSSFLLRVHSHPILGQDALFLRFLQPGSWSDVLFSHNISSSSTSAADSSPTASTFAAGGGAGGVLVGGAGRKLRNPDIKFLELEQSVDAQHSLFAALNREHSKLHTRLSDLLSTQAELGAVLNAFSLHEGNHVALAGAIERCGQAMDLSSLGNQNLSTALQVHFGNYLAEYVKFVAVAQGVLRNRHRLHAQYESLGEQLDSKRIHLSQLEKDSGVSSASASGGALKSVISGLGSIGDRLQQMMDTDPAQTRRNQIAKLKDSISQLENQREDTHTELLKLSEHVAVDLQRFHGQMSVDLRELALSHAKIYREFLSKNRDVWLDALVAIEKV
eukprot:Partr_v1_DN28662_c1_g1_i1_m49451 putative sorting nexin